MSPESGISRDSSTKALNPQLTSDIDEREEDDEVTSQARDAESILDLCLAKGMPHRMLNWHYRSKHQSLIAVSNRGVSTATVPATPAAGAVARVVGIGVA